MNISKIILIICVALLLLDLVIVIALMKNSSRISKSEEFQLEKLDVEESKNGV